MLENESIPDDAAATQRGARDGLRANTSAEEAAGPELVEEKERTPMLDVHPPHEPIHTWKEYLLHMSTIVLGLLIAIGLEQSVEAVHRTRERAELRESLRRDYEKSRTDATASEAVQSTSLKWMDARLDIINDAIANHRQLGMLPKAPHVTSNVPADSVWDAARASGKLSLLSLEEVQVFSEIDVMTHHAGDVFDQGIASSRKRAAFQAKHSAMGNQGYIDLSSATPDDLKEYADLTGQEYSDWDEYRVVCERIRGAETAVLEGERDLTKIQSAELRFYSRVPK